MPEGITLKRIIDMDETQQLSSSDYVLVDSASGGNRKYKLGEDLNNLKDDFHSYHSELGAGYADQLVSSVQAGDKVPYNFRAVPYDATLEMVEGIVGGDVVVNQYAVNGDFASTGSWEISSNATFAVSDNVGTLTLTGSGFSRIRQTFQMVINHKYIIGATLKGVSGRDTIFQVGNATKTFAVTNAYARYSAILMPTSTASGSIHLCGYQSGQSGDTLDYKDYTVIDLTQTFGTQIADYVYSLETATAGAGVAWLKANFPKIFDSGYIAYNAGTMVHVSGLSAHKTVGFNQWDQVAEAGTYSNTGAPMSSSSEIRSKNYIKIISGQTYYFKSPNTLYVTKYDSNYVCLGETGVINGTRTFDDNVKYIRFCTGGSYGGTYKNDICINLSDPTRNGTYEPYEAHEYPLDSTIDLHGILKLDSNNNLYADGDVYKPDGSVSRRYGVVDLGTLIWHGFTQYANVFYADIPTKGLTGNAICSKYPNGGTFTDYSILQDKVLYNSIFLGRVAVKDTAYSTVEEITTAMSGVYLVFELITPTTEQAEPYTQNQICDPNGTEEYISDTVAPVGHVTKYPLDIAGRLDNILSMPTADGTYTLRAVVSNGNVTYSWVSA